MPRVRTRTPRSVDGEQMSGQRVLRLTTYEAPLTQPGYFTAGSRATRRCVLYRVCRLVSLMRIEIADWAPEHCLLTLLSLQRYGCTRHLFTSSSTHYTSVVYGASFRHAPPPLSCSLTHPVPSADSSRRERRLWSSFARRVVASDPQRARALIHWRTRCRGRGRGPSSTSRTPAGWSLRFGGRQARRNRR